MSGREKGEADGPISSQDTLESENELLRNGISGLAESVTKALSLARKVAARFGRDDELGRDAIAFLEETTGQEMRIADDFVLGPNSELILARYAGAAP